MVRRKSVDVKTGDSYNMLTFKTMEKRYSHRYWKCECECGNMTIPLREDRVVNGIVKSCGCLQRRSGQNNPLWKGCGEIDGQFFSFMRWHAKRRKIEFAISIDYIWLLFLEQGGKCALTDIPLYFQSHYDKLKGEIQTASLDRIDSKIGYVEGNVCWVHKDVNYMKNDYTLSHYLKMCRLVTEHHDRSISNVPLTVQ